MTCKAAVLLAGSIGLAAATPSQFMLTDAPITTANACEQFGAAYSEVITKEKCAEGAAAVGKQMIEQPSSVNFPCYHQDGIDLVIWNTGYVSTQPFPPRDIIYHFLCEDPTLAPQPDTTVQQTIVVTTPQLAFIDTTDQITTTAADITPASTAAPGATTAAPTAALTAAPTAAPTAATMSPSAQPTPAPTAGVGSVAPTSAPSGGTGGGSEVVPTAAPTANGGTGGSGGSTAAPTSGPSGGGDGSGILPGCETMAPLPGAVCPMTPDGVCKCAKCQGNFCTVKYQHMAMEFKEGLTNAETESNSPDVKPHDPCSMALSALIHMCPDCEDSGPGSCPSAVRPMPALFSLGNQMEGYLPEGEGEVGVAVVVGLAAASALTATLAMARLRRGADRTHEMQELVATDSVATETDA